jgi:hypothetical protein
MQFRYNNGTSPFYSEAYANTTGTDSLPSGIGSNWSAVKLLMLYFSGLADNNLNEPMYVKLTDGSSPAHTAKVLYDGDANDIKDPNWHEWNIPLSEFTGVDMSNVKRIAIGLGDGVSSPTWSSYMYFDDIQLWPSRCVPSKVAGDIDNDCDIDYYDLRLVLNNWLISDYNVTPVNPTDSNLVGWWKLDETSGDVAADSSVKGNNGTLYGTPEWIAGHINNALRFSPSDANDYVDLPIDSLISSLTNSTFMTWVDFNSTAGGAWQRIFDFGNDPNVYMFLTPRTETSGPMRFAIKKTGGEQLVDAPSTLASGWHHVAVTIDADNNTISLYVDGEFVGQNTAVTLAPNDLGVTTNNWLGRSQWVADAYFDGSLDDFQIYNRALSQGEVAWLAGKTAEFTQPLYLLLTPHNPDIDSYVDGTIDFKDYAVLANLWLKEVWWP